MDDLIGNHSLAAASPKTMDAGSRPRRTASAIASTRLRAPKLLEDVGA